MVRQAVLMCRESGIPTINGAHYFRQMELQPHGWHVAKTDANAALMVTMIQETRNALYSVFPHGCYAKVVRLTSDDALLHGLPPMVAASASPPQGGMPASSSGAISASPPQGGLPATSSSGSEIADYMTAAAAEQAATISAPCRFTDVRLRQGPMAPLAARRTLHSTPMRRAPEGSSYAASTHCAYGFPGDASQANQPSWPTEGTARARR